MRVPTSPTPPVTPSPPDKEPIHLGYVGSLFIVFGLVSLMTALILSGHGERIYRGALQYSPPAESEVEAIEPGEQLAAADFAMFGPFTIKRPGQGIWVSVSSTVPVNNWLFVEGELLDAQQNYLMGFGDELWHETGTDSDGRWDEADTQYDISLSIPEAGQYYLNFKTQGAPRPAQLRITVDYTNGSPIPHVIFGLLTLLVGLTLNEIANQTFIRLIAIAHRASQEANR